MAGKTPLLRRAIPADADEIAAVFLAARKEAMPYLPALHTDNETRAWLREEVLRRAEVHVAEVDGIVVGFAALGDASLEHLYVHPKAQRQGIGSALLALARAERPHGFRLWVFQRNRGARRFYERHGLQLVQATDGADNEEHEPDALYEWKPATRSWRA